jgi:predicted component of viral defense system (DUF524 family)
MTALSEKELRIPLDHIQNQLVLTISADNPETLCNQADAEDHGESPWQLTEGCEYQFEFSDREFTFEKTAGIVKHIRNRPSHGLLRPNTYTGTLLLQILHHPTGKTTALRLEVRSAKTSYRSDYRFMLENITEHCTDLLMQHTSPVVQNFEPDFETDHKTLYQRFSFVKAIVGSDEFTEAIHRILLFPSTKWKSESEERATSSVRRFGRKEIRQLQTGSRRIPLEGNENISTVPERIYTARQFETVDTHENRFVKHALEQFLLFCLKIEKHSPKTRTGEEARSLIHRLEDFLNHDLFRKVSTPVNLHLNSPVLQRKEGYREILRTWLMFDLAAKLIWQGGEDVYGGSKRDMATLYEYWVFFQLLEAVKHVFRIDPVSLADLIGKTHDGLGLKLKQGLHTAVSGISDSGPRKLKVLFSFNRTFGQQRYPGGGSWSRSLRPDYTLSLWPAELSNTEAEEQELMVHVHFDTKYKTEHLFDGGVVSEEDSDGETMNNDIKNRYKKDDILKMHVYRDAIRRTAGAYIIYPGNVPYKVYGFRELLPGLGAFAVSPSRTDTGIGHIEAFIIDVREHLMNRASQREHMAAQTWLVHKNAPVSLHSPLPEFNHQLERLIPDTTTVLIGYYKSSDHLNWCKTNGYYNFRSGNGRGALSLTPSVVGARYLLLYSKEKYTTELWEIIDYPQFWSKQDLIEADYPGEPSQEGYLVLKIQRSKTLLSDNLKWDISLFDQLTESSRKYYPFQVTLTELLNKAITD